MKKIKILIFLILLISLFYFLLKVNILNFIRIYYIQLISIFILYLFLNLFLKKGRYFSLIFFFLLSLFYFFIYPNYIEKKISFSETFNEESNFSDINLNFEIGSGKFLIDGDKIDYDYIFDYSSYKKIFKFKRKNKNQFNYYFFENPTIKKEIFDKSEFNLIFNQEKILSLNIKGESLFLDMKLDNKTKNLIVNLNLKPSFIKIGLPKNSYIEIKFLTKNSFFNVEDLGFKKKNGFEYYYDNGENKVYIEIETFTSYINFYFLDYNN